MQHDKNTWLSNHNPLEESCHCMSCSLKILGGDRWHSFPHIQSILPPNFFPNDLLNHLLYPLLLCQRATSKIREQVIQQVIG